MYLPKAKNIIKQRESDIMQWGGLNKNALIADNEFSSTTNLSTKDFPLISPRQSRAVSYTLTSGTALFSNSSVLSWVDGTSFKYNNVAKGTVTATSKSMVDFNGKIGIFPDNKTYDYVTDTFATMQGHIELVQYGFDTNADVDYTTGATKMRSKNIISVLPSTSYTLTNDKGYTVATVIEYDANAVKLTYNPAANFSAFTTSAQTYYINIDVTGTDISAVVTITNAVYPTEGAIPTVTAATTFNNRVWAVYGDNIYASALGDINNWTTFSSPSVNTDSWKTDTGTSGSFIGIVTYHNAVYAFKSDLMLKLFGDVPSNFQFMRVTNIGCVSAKSIVEVNDVLYFLGSAGVYAYNGGLPELISYPLNETYTSGVAGTDNRRYFISLYNSSTYNLYVYDTWINKWVQEDNSNIKEFAFLSGYAYVLASDNKIYKYNSGTESITLTVISKEWTENSFNKKKVSELNLLADLTAGSTLTVYIRYDNGSFTVIKTAYATTDMNGLRIPILVNSANHYQIKFVMVGDGKIYGLGRTMTIGGKV